MLDAGNEEGLEILLLLSVTGVKQGREEARDEERKFHSFLARLLLLVPLIQPCIFTHTYIEISAPVAPFFFCPCESASSQPILCPFFFKITFLNT